MQNLDPSNILINEAEHRKIYVVYVKDQTREDERLFTANSAVLESFELTNPSASQDQMAEDESHHGRIRYEQSVNTVQKFTQIAYCRDFSKIFLVGDDKKCTAYMIELGVVDANADYILEPWQRVQNLGTEISVMANSWAFPEIFVSFLDQEQHKVIARLPDFDTQQSYFGFNSHSWKT